jgi:branched-chain amino acid transport system permease protein
MKKLKLNKTTRKNFLTYGLVIIAFVILQAMILGGSITSSLKGMLVPICAYVVMAISLNLTVGVLGELSLGHAGFMSVGAFTGVTAAVALQNLIPVAPIRLAIGMIVGAIFAAIAGFLIGIPVLRLKGDYLAIVTLAFGEIIKSIFNNLYVGIDEKKSHVFALETDNIYNEIRADNERVLFIPINIAPEGYFYKPHYKIQLKEYNTCN